MADLQYNIDSLYRLAFPDLASKVLTKLDGTRDHALGALDQALGNGYQVPTEQAATTPQLDFSGINVKRLLQGDELSYLGTPIFQPITFKGGQYDFLGTGKQAGQVVPDSMVSWRLPATATAEFSRAKALEKSKPGRGNSSVKELWGFDDWTVTIRGFLLDPTPDVFPVGELRQLERWAKIADSIEVEGDMFTYLGIYRLAIESLNLSKVAGMPNVVPFQLACVSDEALELSLLSNTLNKLPTTPTVTPNAWSTVSAIPGHVRVIADGSATPKR